MPFFQRTYRLKLPPNHLGTSPNHLGTSPKIQHSTNSQAPSLAPWGNLLAENRVQIYNYFVKRETL